MKPLRSNKKAFTLVELCIVMALVSIVALLMTSFMAVFQPRVAQNQARHDFLDEVSLVREELRKWVEHVDQGSATLVVVETGENLIYRKDAETTQYISFNGSVVTFSYLGNEKTEFELNVIKDIIFEPYLPPVIDVDGEGEALEFPITPENSGKLLKCTLVGVDAFNTAFTQSFVFALDNSTTLYEKDLDSE